MNDRETWRERGSGISVLAARHDDDDDMKISGRICLIDEELPDLASIVTGSRRKF